MSDAVKTTESAENNWISDNPGIFEDKNPAVSVTYSDPSDQYQPVPADTDFRRRYLLANVGDSERLRKDLAPEITYPNTLQYVMQTAFGAPVSLFASDPVGSVVGFPAYWGSSKLINTALPDSEDLSLPRSVLPMPIGMAGQRLTSNFIKNYAPRTFSLLRPLRFIGKLSPWLSVLERGFQDDTDWYVPRDRIDLAAYANAPDQLVGRDPKKILAHRRRLEIATTPYHAAAMLIGGPVGTVLAGPGPLVVNNLVKPTIEAFRTADQPNSNNSWAQLDRYGYLANDVNKSIGAYNYDLAADIVGKRSFMPEGKRALDYVEEESLLRHDGKEFNLAPNQVIDNFPIQLLEDADIHALCNDWTIPNARYDEIQDAARSGVILQGMTKAEEQLYGATIRLDRARNELYGTDNPVLQRGAHRVLFQSAYAEQLLKNTYVPITEKDIEDSVNELLKTQPNISRDALVEWVASLRKQGYRRPTRLEVARQIQMRARDIQRKTGLGYFPALLALEAGINFTDYGINQNWSSSIRPLQVFSRAISQTRIRNTHDINSYLDGYTAPKGQR